MTNDQSSACSQVPAANDVSGVNVVGSPRLKRLTGFSIAVVLGVLCASLGQYWISFSVPPASVWVRVLRVPGGGGYVLDVDRQDVRVAARDEFIRRKNLVVVRVGGVSGSSDDPSDTTGPDIPFMSKRWGRILYVHVASDSLHWVKTHLGFPSIGDRFEPTGAVRAMEGGLWIEVSELR